VHATEPETKARLKAQIEKAEASAKLARVEIEKAKRAEIDVSKQEAELIDTERKIRLLRQVYIEEK